MTPTDEQQAAVDAFSNGVDAKIEAYAGTGKTTVLKMLANTTTDRGVYLAYNSNTAREARGAFPRHVDCRTAHSFGFQWMRGEWGSDVLEDRLNARRHPMWETARNLGISGPTQVGDGDAAKYLAPMQVGRLAMDAVKNFCQSADPELDARHVPRQRGMESKELRPELEQVILPYAEKAWADLCRPTGKLRFTHDNYLKMFALTNPRLPADFILLDEAQDTNPVVGGLFDAHYGLAQRVAVGDANQAIYGWRGAVDFLSTMDAEEHLYLTQSWRFGQAVALEANKWLRLLGVDRPVVGSPLMDSRLARIDVPDAVLCRSNAEAVASLMTYQAELVPVCIVGGGEDFKKLAAAAEELQATGKTGHQELAAFTSWQQVREYVEEAHAGADLKVAVDLIEEWGAVAISNAIDNQVSEQNARVIVSTAHKAKGLEWPRVKIAEDFRPPKPRDGKPVLPEREEMMLAYVAVTRAREVLDNAGLAWVNDYVALANAA